MKIETTFSCGDKAWVFSDSAPELRTIGQVRVIFTDSPGVEQEDIVFDNYAKQSGYEEEYMCIETGIGSGSVYTLNEHIFPTREACETANAKRIAEKKAREARNRAYERRRLLESEDYHRRQLAAIEAAKSEEAQEVQA